MKTTQEMRVYQERFSQLLSKYKEKNFPEKLLKKPNLKVYVKQAVEETKDKYHFATYLERKLVVLLKTLVNAVANDDKRALNTEQDLINEVQDLLMNYKYINGSKQKEQFDISDRQEVLNEILRNVNYLIENNVYWAVIDNDIVKE